MRLIELLKVKDATALEHLSHAQLTELQSALLELGFPIDQVDGVFGPNTQKAWALFKVSVSTSEFDLIGPASIQTLQHSLDLPEPELQDSGPAWVERFPRSVSLDDLVPPFLSASTRMVGALRAGGVRVDIASTLRPPQRAYLMFFSKRIAERKVAPNDVRRRFDVPIRWVHGSNAESVNAATALFEAYNIQGPVAIASNHIFGHAIDMSFDVVGSPTVRDASGNSVRLTGDLNDQHNASILSFGRTFGVIRGVNIPNDPEHWSINGT